MKKAVYPGTFDPLTKGHLDVIERASKLVGELHVLVADNPRKTPSFSAEERVSMIKSVTKHINNLVVSSSNNLVVRYADANKIEIMIRGLRNIQDYENEYMLHRFNKNISNDIETLLLFPTSSNHFVSSSAIKELVIHNADISLYIPKPLVKMVEERLRPVK